MTRPRSINKKLTQEVYDRIKSVAKSKSTPTLYLDLVSFDENTRAFEKLSGSKNIRLATKSLRCPFLFQRVLDHSKAFQGLMAYSLEEAIFLVDQGFKDILVAYPTVSVDLIRHVLKAPYSTHITLAVSQSEHLTIIDSALRQVSPKDLPAHKIKVAIDLDTSWNLPFVFFGVRRSAIKTAREITTLASEIIERSHLVLAGLISYEAQIAGVKDDEPGHFLKNLLVRLLKKQNKSILHTQRDEAWKSIKAILPEMSHSKLIFNGGGSGSLRDASNDPTLTEVSAGSGLYCPHLFDHYSNYQYKPALFFSLPVTRSHPPRWLTLHGGGFVASGESGCDRLPVICEDFGQITKAEAFGEVQTPIILSKRASSADTLLGNVMIARPAKAGEICERFKSITVINQDGTSFEVPTYRGLGQCFH